MHKTYPYMPLLKEESLLFPLLRPQRCRVYIYRPKYRETKEEFDRGCRGRRLKKIQNTGNASVEAKEKKEKGSCGNQKALEPLSSDGWFLGPWSFGSSALKGPSEIYMEIANLRSGFTNASKTSERNDSCAPRGGWKETRQGSGASRREKPRGDSFPIVTRGGKGLRG